MSAPNSLNPIHLAEMWEALAIQYDAVGEKLKSEAYRGSAKTYRSCAATLRRVCNKNEVLIRNDKTEGTSTDEVSCPRCEGD